MFFIFLVPAFSKIACFNTGSSYLSDVLGDFKSQVADKKHQVVISTCAELAFDKGYQFFALGYNGLCRSGPNARDEYHKEGATSDNNCVNGIGINKRIAVYTFGEFHVNNICLTVSDNICQNGVGIGKPIAVYTIDETLAFETEVGLVFYYRFHKRTHAYLKREARELRELKQRRKSDFLSPKSFFFFYVETTFRHIFLPGEGEMLAPWRSQKSLRKHKDSIIGNSVIR